MKKTLDKIDNNLNHIETIWQKHCVKLIWIGVIIIGGLAYIRAT